MVYKFIGETGLDWEGLIEELLIKVLLLFVHKHTGVTSFVELGTTRSPYHLEEISEREVNISLGLGVEVFSPLDNHQSRREVHSPSKSARCHQYLDLLLHK